MKSCYETQYYALLQSHCLCCIQEILQAQFCLPPREGKGHFLHILGVRNGHIEEVVCWRQLIILSWPIKREILQMHVVVACDKAEKQQLHVVRQVELRNTAILNDVLCNLFVRSLVFLFRRMQRQLAHVLHVYLLTGLGAINAFGDVA